MKVVAEENKIKQNNTTQQNKHTNRSICLVIGRNNEGQFRKLVSLCRSIRQIQNNGVTVNEKNSKRWVAANKKDTKRWLALIEKCNTGWL